MTRAMACALAAALLAIGARADDPAPKKVAVLVGVNRYDHRAIQELKFCENDVTDLGTVLRAGGWTVMVLSDSAGEKNREMRPTRANVLRAVDQAVRDTRKPDLFLFAFAGQGVQFRDDASPYLCPCDARPAEKDTLVSLAGLIDAADRKGPGTCLFLVDACRNDPISSRSGGGDVGRFTVPTGFGVLLSCSRGERAYETEKLNHGIFFHAVIEGLKGKAANRTGAVTWGRLVEYVREYVEQEAPKLIEAEVRQRPHMVADLVQEPVLIAGKGPAR